MNIPFEEQIARVCHEANRAYCATLGDQSQPPWADAPQWQKDSAIQGVQFHLASHKAHEKWLEQKRNEGWQYGPVKDPEHELHPFFMPYDVDQRMKDYIFGSIVQAFFEGSSDGALYSSI